MTFELSGERCGLSLLPMRRGKRGLPRLWRAADSGMNNVHHRIFLTQARPFVAIGIYAP